MELWLVGFSSRIFNGGDENTLKDELHIFSSSEQAVDYCKKHIKTIYQEEEFL